MLDNKVEGYTATVIGYDITNTLDQSNTVVVGGTKSWVDNNNSNGTRPEKIIVELYADGKATGKTAEVNAKTNWGYEFRELPKYNDNKSAIVYSVQESAVEGYTETYVATETGYNIINTLNQVNDVTVSGTKSWVDGNNSNGTRPESITVRLYDDGERTEKAAVVNAESNWTYTFSDLPRYNANKSAIIYTVQEDAVDKYDSKQNGTDFTNIIAQEEITISGTKTWNMITGEDYPSVTINLLRDGIEISEVTLNPGKTDYQFSNLPKYAVG